MSLPIVEQIAVNIEAAINQITVANGFNQTLKAERPKRQNLLGEVYQNGTVLIIQSDEELPDNQPTFSSDWEQPFVLMAIVLDSDKSEAGIDTKLNLVKADITKKICEDTSRGGLAIDTRILPSSAFTDGQGFSGIAVGIVVYYRTEEDDPYTQ